MTCPMGLSRHSNEISGARGTIAAPMRFSASQTMRAATVALAVVSAIWAGTFSTAALSSIQFDEELVSSFAARYGEGARQRLLDWEELLSQWHTSGVAAQRVAVNDFFNRIPWLSDEVHWGRRDYWATPLEMLGTNGGDCEDFSISKYFSLAQLQVPTEKLLITYVRAKSIDQAHMVLAYYPTPDADPYILDNLVDQVRRASERADLIPVYSFNGDGLWWAVEHGLGRRVGSPAQLDEWRKVLERMHAERSPGLAKGAP